MQAIVDDCLLDAGTDLGEPMGQAAVAEVYRDGCLDAISGDAFGNDFGEFGQTLAGRRGDGNRVADPAGYQMYFRDVRQTVDLVEDDQRVFFPAADVFEDLLDGLDLLERVTAGDVGDVQEQVGVDGLFEGRFEAGDEVVGQVAHEADGVG